MKTKPRIAIYSGVSTSTTFVERLISGLAKQGITVLVFGLDNGKKQQSNTIIYSTYKGRLNKLWRLWKYSLLLWLTQAQAKKRLDAIITEQNYKNRAILKVKYYPVLYYKPDIFHLQWAKSIKDWIWVDDFGIRMVLSLRGTHLTISPNANLELKNIYKALFPKVSAFHCVSLSIANELLAYDESRPKHYIVKSGLPLNEFRFSSNLKMDRPVKRLSIGRAHFAKGYRYALDAMALLKTQSVPFKYTIIGVGQDEALWYQRYDLDIEDYVEFTEQQVFNDVKKALIDADILLVPSLTEGIANVVLEAMALGTLVVSSDCGGMSEVIKDGETGFLFPIQDSKALSQVLLRASHLNNDEYQSVITNARKFIEENHSEVKMIYEMEELYNSIMLIDP